MNIFDKSIQKILECLKNKTINKLDNQVSACKTVEKNCFLMERDTKIELGGYPNESINIFVPSENLSKLIRQTETLDLTADSGIFCIGDPDFISSEQKHISFGKIVLLETENISDDKWYDFTQKELLTDTKIYIQDVMLRQSSTHYNTNLRIGKKAYKEGLTASSLAKTIRDAYLKIDGVKNAIVVLISGENPIYKELLETAEQIKEITLALNHIFDGIDMDCGHCNLVEICNEVEGIRKLHKKMG